MWVPNALPAILSFSLRFPFLQIFLRRLSLGLLELRPSIFEYLYGDIESVNLGSPDIDISGVFGRGRNGARGREGDFLPYRQGAKEFPCLKGPVLRWVCFVR